MVPKTRLYRNFDQEFERTLQRQSAVRRIEVDMNLGENAFGFTLTLTDEDGNRASTAIEYAKETARSPQDENRRTQLAKLGVRPWWRGASGLIFRQLVYSFVGAGGSAPACHGGAAEDTAAELPPRNGIT